MSKCNCNCKNNGSGCRNKHEYPRIRDLPEDEQEPFKTWLEYQTVPCVDDLPMEEQDFYYQHDYNKWKHLLEVKHQQSEKIKLVNKLS